MALLLCYSIESHEAKIIVLHLSGQMGEEFVFLSTAEAITLADQLIRTYVNLPQNKYSWIVNLPSCKWEQFACQLMALAASPSNNPKIGVNLPICFVIGMEDLWTNRVILTYQGSDSL